MTITLLPRLRQIAVDRILDELGEELSMSASVDLVSSLPEDMSYATSGGSPIQQEALRDIRRMLVSTAEKHGFPEKTSTKARAAFDVDLAKILGGHPDFVPPEALRDDVWAFMTSVVAPDVVKWRFGTSSRERYYGGIRNAFQRLWMRAWSLDRGVRSEDRWLLVRELTEDAIVQITERPSVGGDRKFARALAEGWVRMAETAGRGAMEAIMRRAVISLRIRNQIQNLSALDDPSLHHVVDEAFAQAKASLDHEESTVGLHEHAASPMSASWSNEQTSVANTAPYKTEEEGTFSRLRTFIGRRKRNSE